MSGEVIVTRPEKGVVLVELDNPPVNAMSGAMLATTERALADVQADHSVRAIVLTGRGRAFCSGADLKEAAQARSGGGDLSTFVRLLERVASIRVPIVAAINGHCVGGGFELALCCDIRVASSDAKFVCAGVNMGLMASTYRLPRLIGVSRAKAMLLTGLPHDAECAERWGLVTSVHPPGELMSGALRLAARIATRAPLSVEASKRVADRALDMSPEQASAVLATEMPRLRQSHDHREAIRAFSEKREPQFTRS